MPLQIVNSDVFKTQCDAVVRAVYEILPPDIERTRIIAGIKEHILIETYVPAGYIKEQGVKALKSCYTDSLMLAKNNGCESIAIPFMHYDSFKNPQHNTLSYAIKIIKSFLRHSDIDIFLFVEDRRNISDERLRREIDTYIANNNVVGEELFEIPENVDLFQLKDNTTNFSVYHSALREYLKTTDKSFIDTLFEYIDQKGIKKDSQCYRKANVDRKTFSKLRNNPDQRPKKQTAVALALALELTLEETQHLLATAGWTLSKSNDFDNIIRYFIDKRIYDIYKINEALFDFRQPLLGSV